MAPSPADKQSVSVHPHGATEEGVEYATIARTGSVSFTGTRPSYAPDGIPVRFEVTTYDQPEDFDWSQLFDEVPVIDWRSVDFDTTWDVGIRPTYKDTAERLAACRAAGVHVRCVCYWRTTFYHAV
jgi:hypothetical protein